MRDLTKCFNKHVQCDKGPGTPLTLLTYPCCLKFYQCPLFFQAQPPLYSSGGAYAVSISPQPEPSVKPFIKADLGNN